ncbi:ABC transporter substrate-binding protein [Flavobacterium sp. DGU38]|uniref:ABC transporter substrate-binding protein n=1 Tax=Flavobacterium calami TaxID=3139144 RepID=A0ABU9IUT7_9FLAO
MNGDIKIGILIPQSRQYATLDKDFMRGVKLNGLNVKFFVESIGIGADEQMIIDKMQKLNFQEEISLIIGFFGHHNMTQIYEYASKNDIVLIASDLGATIPYNTSGYKGVYFNSFGLIESCYSLGDYLLTNNYQKIVSATSYYDSGYGMLSALEGSFKEGISFSGHYITPFMPREDEAVLMDQLITAQEPDAVFAFYSGLYAEENAAFLKQNKLTQKYPFYVTPFFINDNIMEQYKNAPHDLYVVGSWMQNNEDAHSFNEEYRNTYSESPSVFSLLGYESGLIIKNILNNSDNDLRANVLIEKLNKLNIAGPRGTIQFEKDINRTIFNHHIYKLNTDPLSNARFDKMETLVNDGQFIKAVTLYKQPAKFGGWQNAYLCH